MEIASVVSQFKASGRAAGMATQHVTALLRDARLEFNLDGGGWKRALDYLRTCRGECDVDITTVELEP
jgi:hypothetical protein